MPVIQPHTKIRLPRITPERVAAVCTQLGDAVSLRNVQRAIGGSFRDLGPLVRAWQEDNAGKPTYQDLQKLGGKIQADLGTAATSQAAVVKEMREVVTHLPRNTDTRLREQSERLARIEAALAKPNNVIDFQQALQPLSARLGGVELAIAAIGDLAPAVEGVHRMIGDLNTTLLSLTDRLEALANSAQPATGIGSEIAEPLRQIVARLEAVAIPNMDAILSRQADRNKALVARQQRASVSAQARIEAQLADLAKRVSNLAKNKAIPRTKSAKSVKNKKPARTASGLSRNPGRKSPMRRTGAKGASKPKLSPTNTRRKLGRKRKK